MGMPHPSLFVLSGLRLRASESVWHALAGTRPVPLWGRTIADYSIDFRTRVHRSEWNVAAQCDAFLVGLEDYVKDRLVSYELPRSLDELIELSTRVDGRIQGRRREKRQGPLEWHSPVSLPTPLKQEVESMLVSHTSNLSPDSCPLCQAHLLLSEGSHTLAVFIDSSAKHPAGSPSAPIPGLRPRWPPCGDSHPPDDTPLSIPVW